ncbi:ScyD/ScyE family protein [Occallatibacter savannae]|uniref:ScyD/ScyE family protein n=1 Tax=Occallatibacter savannae TaxID=1002691 RepID=UPI0013A54412|nr:ScyD/ScyE family protein [Occallatibacter savannae]
MTRYEKLRTLTALSLFLSICSFSSAQRFPHRTGNAKSGLQSSLATATVFATDLRFPRGLKFGPDSRLYVAESGLGGTDNTVGLCDQDPNFGPFLSGRTSRVTSFDLQRKRTVVVDNLPSSVDIFGETFGAADVAFLGNTLYIVTNGSGCSQGVSYANNGILRRNGDGSLTQINDLSVWTQNNPVANPPCCDFDLEGVWWTLNTRNGVFYTNNANTGDILQVAPDGTTTRVIDMSASEGHNVPTAVAQNGNFYIANLGNFPIIPGSSSLYKLLPSGTLMKVFDGLTAVIGQVFLNGKLYALETSTAADFPLPGSGKIVRVSDSGEITDVLTGLTFPTAITAGPDGALYVSEFGYGDDPTAGRILQVRLK